MATVAECEKALGRLADKLAGQARDGRKAVALERTLSCRLTDIGVTFVGRLSDGRLLDIRLADVSHDRPADIRLTMQSDDLPALIDGELNVPKAWATGRVRVSAGVRDLLRLKALF